MKIIEKKIPVLKSARYYAIIPESSVIKTFWIVIHGYAQLAKTFIKEFEFLHNDETIVIAPEGLSKFYFRNEIGASWMTKEDRINEIDDYLNYLDKIFIDILYIYNVSEAKINLLGFSQGVHTAVRWFIHTNNHIDNLVLCSSDFPKDADFIKLKEKMLRSEMFFIYGERDEVINKKTFEESKELLNEKNINYKEITFKSGHSIDKSSLQILMK